MIKSINCIGVSSDWRTNVWRVNCDCGKWFEPPTTLYSCQNIECPKCGLTEFVNYNEIVEDKGELNEQE